MTLAQQLHRSAAHKKDGPDPNCPVCAPQNFNMRTKVTRTVNLTLTRAEANAVLRALNVANENERTMQTDRGPNAWVAKRLLGLLHAEAAEETKRLRQEFEQ